MTNPLLDKLAHGPLLGDGAMGTSLLAIGHSSDTCLEQLNLTHREDVGSIHRAMIAAGANLIETNTFGGNRYRLEAHGLQDQVRQFNMRAVKIAREAREISGEDVVVAGSIGPTGRTLAPIGQLTVADAEAAFQEQTEALLEGGVDCFLIETMGDLAETKAAITAIRRVSDLPIIASMSFGEDGLTYRHVSPETVATELSALDVQVIGANCSVGPKALLRVITRMRKALNKAERTPKLIAMPNAGFPTVANGRLVYSATPEYFASFAVDAYNAGADVIGGCCGTTNDHIAAMRKALDGVLPRETEQTAKASAPRISIVDTSDQPSQIKQALGRRFLRCVEIQPPKGLNPTKALDGARLLKEAGVDAITVADSPMARVRMSALTMCYLIQHEVGIETILHYTTRDRSMMGLQSDLLGAHASGVRNILALTGDPPSLGDNIASTGVFDVDSIGLIRIISGMNQGADSAGTSIGRNANFTILCAVDPTKADLEEEARRLHLKIEAGAEFVMTQPIFDPQVWLDFLKIYGEPKLSIPVMIGILPLQSSKHAEFLHNELPGITLTNEARHRMKLAGEHGRQEGIKMAQELLLELRQHAEGVYLMPSFGRYETAAEVISILGEDDTGQSHLT
ncbi:MAG: bifunctional homocysteine S-methyltransferase/methylenetetrahydrofolate reductase [Thermomicrobiales bacterium]|nr:bifunctional homocysteine S-methyltransferase/methylenetetrahydrofolate reductase [Thermomicrobiales bacterium]MCO5228913.1 bifunctional homocysteine S-methyltransferase/methylenetetrahydrofolate reductase [Thermomicrobiales bacterium]